MDYSDRTASTRSSSEGAGKIWDETRQKTEDLIDSGEECVSENPASAVIVTFLGGALIGAFVGWTLAELRQERRRPALSGVLGDLRQRLHL